MYKWADFLTKLAGIDVSETHKLLIKQKFLDILRVNYSNMIPKDCKIVLAKVNPNDSNSKNSLFVSIDSKNRTSSETDVPMLVENELNKYFKSSNINYIYNSDTNKFLIDISASELPTHGIQQRKQEQ